MTGEELTSLDALIGQNGNFAIYRTPGEQTPRFLMQESDLPSTAPDLASLNGADGFVIAPFKASGAAPIVLIRPDIELIPQTVEQMKLPGAPLPPHPLVADPFPGDYPCYFSLFLKQLETGRFDKIVLSRPMTISREAAFSPAQAFDRACHLYPHAFIYLCHTPLTGTWLGSSPEVLLASSNGQGHTVALAGTRAGARQEPWDTKNLAEQAIVADYVRSRLAAFGLTATEQGPFTVRSGGVTHLKSDFDFPLPDPMRLGSLLDLLHPTPAVCGLPKEDSYRFILEHEGYDRRYYSGFAGRMTPGGETALYVNLRCMNIGETDLTLYAGGGLLKASDCGEEIRELEAKLQTMLALTHPPADVHQ